jgi:hypothetical protein
VGVRVESKHEIHISCIPYTHSLKINPYSIVSVHGFDYD